ncbi:hypothetical protein ACH5RR_005090 [Cinchona calisaya]|uniref:ATP-dependent DNA helicase n=1 Tax=Cinchona calisaya TaxID=153742 RepID=A0ABD3B098_9GENT
MHKRTAVEALDDLLRDLMESREIFGGKVVVLGGDFGQTLPVVRKGNKCDEIDTCLSNFRLWPKLQKLYLTDNMRARLDLEFTEYFFRIGNGTEQVHECDNIKHIFHNCPSIQIQIY